jgi:hypothetical protein
VSSVFGATPSTGVTDEVTVPILESNAIAVNGYAAMPAVIGVGSTLSAASNASGTPASALPSPIRCRRSQFVTGTPLAGLAACSQPGAAAPGPLLQPHQLFSAVTRPALSTYGAVAVFCTPSPLPTRRLKLIVAAALPLVDAMRTPAICASSTVLPVTRIGCTVFGGVCAKDGLVAEWMVLMPTLQPSITLSAITTCLPPPE